MATPDLVMGMDPTPAEVDFLEHRLYEFNSQATGIVDASGITVFGRDARGEVVAPDSAGTPGAGAARFVRCGCTRSIAGRGLVVVFSNWRRQSRGAGVVFRLCSQPTASKRQSSIASWGSRSSTAFLIIPVVINICICERFWSRARGQWLAACWLTTLHRRRAGVPGICHGGSRCRGYTPIRQAEPARPRQTELMENNIIQRIADGRTDLVLDYVSDGHPADSHGSETAWRSSSGAPTTGM